MVNTQLVYVARSDGVLSYHPKEKGSRREQQAAEPNAPSAEMQARTKDAKGLFNFYHELDATHASSVDWRKKLGNALVKELGTEEHNGKSLSTPVRFVAANRTSTGKLFMLADFPENYRLFEHKRVASLNPADRGPNDRRDFYLYGHPDGPNRRFKSPNEFALHLLWLAQGVSDEANDCTCKVCVPDKIYKTAHELKAYQAKRDRDGNGNGQVLEKLQPADTSLSIKSEPRKFTPKRPATGPAKSTQPTAMGSNAELSPAMHLFLSTPLPIIRDPEQREDILTNMFLYRPGELVWFERDKAWGLAVVQSRQAYKNNRQLERAAYLVQPLSHPLEHPASITVMKDDMLRPWLSWSAPIPTHDALKGEGLTYSTIDWQGVIGGRFGAGDVEVDGSIFAAKAIDSSFTLFGKNETLTKDEPDYNGIYWGGEKIWTSETVRLRTGNGQDIMVLHLITRHVNTSTRMAEVYAIGDVYSLQTVPHKAGYPVPQTPYLPQRLSNDLKFRNKASIDAHTGVVSQWKLVQALARLNFKDVKGRWYESRTLLPSIQTQRVFGAHLQRGEVGDVGNWLNGRGDSSMGMPISETTDRLAAIGAAVPRGMVIGMPMHGILQQLQQSLQPPEQSSMAANRTHQGPNNATDVGGPLDPGVAENALAEFVDVDRLEEGGVQGYSG
jgi:hypothetical protein